MLKETAGLPGPPGMTSPFDGLPERSEMTCSRAGMAVLATTLSQRFWVVESGA